MDPKNKTQSPSKQEPKSFHLQPGVKSFVVDRENNKLTEVVILAGNREAKGHGIYIDATTLQSALDSVTEKGGQLKAYYTHDHRGAGVSWINNYTEESASELKIPGFFSNFRIQNDQLIAGEFEFYESFSNSNPEIVSQILEMAEKTPNLLSQSIESWGYAVYVDTDGTEYQTRPEDTELQYEGMPAFRITDLYSSAFVADGAATDGLFAKLSSAFGKKNREETLSLFREAFGTWAKENQSEFSNENHKPKNIMNEKIKARFGTDRDRMARALMLHVEKPDLDLDQIESALKEEDKDKEIASLKSKITSLEAKTKEDSSKDHELKQLQARFEKLKTSGTEKEVDLGAGAEGGQSPSGRTYSGVSLKIAQQRAKEGRQFAITGPADLWTPEQWIQGMPEVSLRSTELMRSGVIVTGAQFDSIANGGGVQGNVPFFAEPDHDDEPQVAGTGPTKNGITSGTMIAPILNRVNTIGAEALAGAVSNSDPIGFGMQIAGGLRMRNRQKTLINILRGLFGVGSGAFDTLRQASFVETVGSQTADHFIDRDLFIDAQGLLGEAKSKLSNGGVIMMHSNIESALSKQDGQITTIKDSEGKPMLKLYNNLIIILNDSLVRAGSTSGLVYDSYIFAPGSIAMGDKPQTNKIGDVAHLVADVDYNANDATIYDRNRFVIHPMGAKWTGTPGGQSASNAELATEGNWDLAYGDVKSAGVVQIVTNG